MFPENNSWVVSSWGAAEWTWSDLRVLGALVQSQSGSSQAAQELWKEREKKKNKMLWADVLKHFTTCTFSLLPSSRGRPRHSAEKADLETLASFSKVAGRPLKCSVNCPDCGLTSVTPQKTQSAAAHSAPHTIKTLKLKCHISSGAETETPAMGWDSLTHVQSTAAEPDAGWHLERAGVHGKTQTTKTVDSRALQDLWSRADKGAQGFNKSVQVSSASGLGSAGRRRRAAELVKCCAH